jgi:hypothetical protein
MMSTASGPVDSPRQDRHPEPDRRPGGAVPVDAPQAAPIDAPTDETENEFTRDRKSVVGREKEAFGGVKIGSAFFGWLAATGTAVLLTALVAAAGTAVGVATNTDARTVVNQATGASGTVGVAGGVALLVVLFVAYYCGGYVAGRMARFNGIKQGVAVWVWALLIAIVVALLGAIAGTRYNILGQLNSFPRIPVNEGDLTGAGIVAALAVAVSSLVGAVLGGLAGMRFHRRVDRAGLGA